MNAYIHTHTPTHTHAVFIYNLSVTFRVNVKLLIESMKKGLSATNPVSYCLMTGTWFLKPFLYYQLCSSLTCFIENMKYLLSMLCSWHNWYCIYHNFIPDCSYSCHHITWCYVHVHGCTSTSVLR